MDFPRSSWPQFQISTNVSLVLYCLTCIIFNSLSRCLVSCVSCATLCKTVCCLQIVCGRCLKRTTLGQVTEGPSLSLGDSGVVNTKQSAKRHIKYWECYFTALLPPRAFTTSHEPGPRLHIPLFVSTGTHPSWLAPQSLEKCYFKINVKTVFREIRETWSSS